jgi:hypothetical protein
MTLGVDARVEESHRGGVSQDVRGDRFVVQRGATRGGRLSACVLIEAHVEWQVAERRYLSEASMAQLTPPTPTVLMLDANSTQEVSPAPAAQTA